MPACAVIINAYRTASDLEEWGWIDKTQKGVLKDLLISGNTDLQNALDKFRGGDTTLLQGIDNMLIFMLLVIHN